MILGEKKKTTMGGPLGPIKKQWAKLPPKKQKTITITLFAIMILVFAAMGYHSRQSSGRLPTSEKKATASREIALNSDLIEKSLFRQAQDTINQQGRVIADLRKEIAHVKAVTEETAKNAGSHDMPKLPPPPQKTSANEPGQLQPSLPPPDYGLVPPPPVFKESKPGDLESLIGGITVVSNPSAPEKPLDADTKKKFQIYLPPSFMEATLLSGLDAPTTTTGNSDPVPVLLRIKELAILPNKVRGDLKGCFVLAEGKGNLASERVEVRLVTLSCVSKKGQSVIDQAVKGYVVDEDGKAGLRGIVSAKMGAMLARSALAGFLGGVGEAVQSSSMDFQTTAMGTQTQIWSDTDTKNMVKGGIGGGISKSAEQLEKFYLQLAEQTLPIIQVGATKTVTVVISEGINLEVRDAAIIN